MSMMKRIFALLLTVAMLVSVLTACNKPQTPDQTTETTTPDPNPLPNPPETPAKKITSVKISSGESPIENFAATELKGWLQNYSRREQPYGYGRRQSRPCLRPLRFS